MLDTPSIFLLLIIGLAAAGLLCRKRLIARSILTIALVAVIGVGLSGRF